MPEHQRLGVDKDGNVFIKEWEKNLGTCAGGFFGYLTDCFKDGIKRPWQDADADFVWMVKVTDVNGVERMLPSAFPDADHASHFRATTERNRFVKFQTEFIKEGPRIMTFLLDGTMSKESRVRLMSVIDNNNNPTLTNLQRSNDIMGLKEKIISIHDYKGLSIDKKDRTEVIKLFVELQTSKKFESGDTLEGIQRDYEEIVRKMKTFGIVGNRDPVMDMFDQTTMFDAFMKPLESHYIESIRNRTVELELGKDLTVDKTDPEEIQKEFLRLKKLEKMWIDVHGPIKAKGKDKNNSVLVTNQVKEKKTESGKVNSAMAGVRKSLNKQLENKGKDGDKKKKGLFISKEKHPKTWEKLQKLMKENNCSLVDALQMIECWNCNKKGHLSVECPEGVKKESGDKPKKKFDNKKKFGKKKGGVNFADVESSDDDDEEDDECFHFVINGEELEEDPDYVTDFSQANPMRNSSELPVEDLFVSEAILDSLYSNNNNLEFTLEDEESEEESVQSGSSLKDITAKIKKSEEGPREGSVNFTCNSNNVSYDDMPELISNSDSSDNDDHLNQIRNSINCRNSPRSNHEAGDSVPEPGRLFVVQGSVEQAMEDYSGLFASVYPLTMEESPEVTRRFWLARIGSGYLRIRDQEDLIVRRIHVSRIGGVPEDDELVVLYQLATGAPPAN